jgi:cob(I)alamin adenosyltransferase
LVTPLVKDGQASPAVGRYLNRLSDFLFVAARHAAKADGKEEVIYKKPKD